MAIDTHIKFDGIDGESTHKDHKGEIDVLSWSWGLTQAGNPSNGGGSGRSKAVPGEFRIVHSYDKASPLLARTAAPGPHAAHAANPGQGRIRMALVANLEECLEAAQRQRAFRRRTVLHRRAATGGLDLRRRSIRPGRADRARLPGPGLAVPLCIPAAAADAWRQGAVAAIPHPRESDLNSACFWSPR